MSALFKGAKLSDEVRAKISVNHARHMLGKKHSAESRQKMSVGMKGRVPWNKGIKVNIPISDAERERRRQRLLGVRVGPKNPGWKGGVTPIRMRLWFSANYREWRQRIFVQDDFTCRLCGARSGNGVAVRLEADHFPIPFVAFLDALRALHGVENLYEAAIADTALWAAEGRTLCRKCHNTTKRGRFTLAEHLRAKQDEFRYAGHQ